jgi:N-acetyl-gamma-glutamylphosphate reductase
MRGWSWRACSRRHPSFRLQLAVTDRWAGKRLGQQVAISGPAGELVCVGQEAGKARLGDLDLVFLATPAEASIEIAPRALDAGARVVDISGGFRLPASDYPPGTASSMPTRGCWQKRVLHARGDRHRSAAGGAAGV